MDREPLETKMPQRLRRARSARLPDCPATLVATTLQLRYQDPNLSRLLSCENDSSSYSGTYKVGKKKSSAFRFPPCVAYCADGSSRNRQVQALQPPCHSRRPLSHERGSADLCVRRRRLRIPGVFSIHCYAAYSGARRLPLPGHVQSPAADIEGISACRSGFRDSPPQRDRQCTEESADWLLGDVVHKGEGILHAPRDRAQPLGGF